MKITTIGRGSIGGTLARLWTAAGHEVTTLGRDGGDASDADVVLLAVRHADIPAALAGVTGLEGKTVIEASNRLDREAPHEGHRIQRRVREGGPWRPHRQGVQPQLRQAAGRRCSGTQPAGQHLGRRRSGAGGRRAAHT